MRLEVLEHRRELGRSQLPHHELAYRAIEARYGGRYVGRVKRACDPERAGSIARLQQLDDARGRILGRKRRNGVVAPGAHRCEISNVAMPNRTRAPTTSVAFVSQIGAETAGS